MTAPPLAGSQVEEQTDLMGLPVTLRRGGEGPPLVLLPHDIGVDGWGPFHDALAARHALLAPVLPGYDGTPRFDWMRSLRDMAAAVQLLLDGLLAEPCTLVGLGFGGWIAAEMATLAQTRLHRLVLVGAAGLKPGEGEILDQFLLSHVDFVRAGFPSPAAYDAVYGAEPDVDRLVRWDENREMTGRIAWKPYMHNPALPHLLREVRTPTLVCWGSDDRVVPPACAAQFLDALPNATLRTFQGGGHYLDLEQPAALAAAVTGFSLA